MSNRVDPDLDLCCLQKSIIACGSERIKIIKQMFTWEFQSKIPSRTVDMAHEDMKTIWDLTLENLQAGMCA